MAPSRYRLVGVEGGEGGAEFELAERAVVGRDRHSADIVLADHEVSRRHARFTQVDGTLTVEDLGSTNGTAVNGELLDGPRALAEGDRVEIGTTVLELRGAGSETKVAAATPRFAGRQTGADAAVQAPAPEPDSPAPPPDAPAPPPDPPPPAVAARPVAPQSPVYARGPQSPPAPPVAYDGQHRFAAAAPAAAGYREGAGDRLGHPGAAPGRTGRDPALRAPSKRSEVAMGLSLVPGLGHAYAGEYSNALLFFGGWVIAWFMFMLTPVLIVLVLALWAGAAFDARRAVTQQARS
jgi:hypothetical protein